MRVIDRAIRRAKELGMNQTQFGAALDASPQQVTNWKAKDMPADYYLPAARLLNWSVDELLGNHLFAVDIPRATPDVEHYEEPRKNVTVSFRVAPLISWVQAGAYSEAHDPYPVGDAEDWVPVLSRKAGPNVYALRVRGDSMINPLDHRRTYPEGCIILVDPDQLSPLSGDRIIAKIHGSPDVTFKVYRNEDGRQWLQALNPTYPRLDDPFKVLGTVIGKWDE